MMSIDTAGEAEPFAMEHRWGQRKPCSATVRIAADTGLDGPGRMRNISSSGAFIETALELAVGAHVALAISTTEAPGREMTLAAIVVRVDVAGVGLEWCETPSGSICAVLGCTRHCAAGTARE